MSTQRADGSQVDRCAIARLAPAIHHTVLLERPQLLERLISAQAQLLLVEAPAGFGKTSLLDAWRRRCLQEGALVAWLTLDEIDRDAAELLADIEQALLHAGLTFGDMGSIEPVHRVRAVLNAIARATQQVVLVLDGFEQAGADTGRLVIQRLLKHAPSNLQLVIAGRARPAMHIAALRSRGLVLTLGRDDLKLRPEEIAQLFGCKLSRRELSVVVQTTQGWPAAVQLLRSAWSRGAAVASETAVWGCVELAEYVCEEVLSALTPEQRSTFLQISVLDTLTADAVHAVTGRPGAWIQILEAERMVAFLNPRQDATQEWRLHPLMHEVLARQFATVATEQRAMVMRSAARWYASRKQIVRAISYALACEDLELAASLIEEAGGVHIWMRHGKAVTMGVDALLTEALLDRFPRIRLLRALVQIKNGQLGAARVSFDQALRAGKRDPLVIRQSPIVEATLLINECRPADDVYLSSFEQAISEVSGEDHILRGLVSNLYCIACAQRGLFEKAVPAAHAAMEHYRQAGSTHGQIFEYLHLGNIAFAQGMPTVAKASYARSRDLARRHFGEDQTKIALLGALCGELAYEQNLLPQALRFTRQAAQEVPRIELWYDVYAAQFVTSAMLALDRGGIAEALAVIEAARQEATERRAIGVLRLLDATRASCLALVGEVEEAQETIVQGRFELVSYLDSDEVRVWREQEAVFVAALRVAARKSVPDVSIVAVEEALNRMWTGRQVKAAIRVGATLASLYWALERPAQALAHLDSVLRASQRSGYVRVFMEDREHVRSVLKCWCESVGAGADGQVTQHAAALLAALDRDVARPAGQINLTAREGEILQEISRGRSDKEIARALRLSENTVKFHLKNLYAKLQVGRRIDAVQQARRRGIVH